MDIPNDRQNKKMIFKLFKRNETTSKSQPTQSKSQPTQLWTDVSTNQQETMKGGYPWPGFPPTGGGGGFNGGNSNGKAVGHQ